MGLSCAGTRDTEDGTTRFCIPCPAISDGPEMLELVFMRQSEFSPVFSSMCSKVCFYRFGFHSLGTSVDVLLIFS